MSTASATHSASMPSSSTADSDLKNIKAALIRPSGAYLGAKLGRQTLPYVYGSTISQKARKIGMKKIGLSLDSICRREKIFTQNASDPLDLLEGALTKSIDFYVTDTTTTDDEHRRLTVIVVAELDTMKDKQGFFVLIEPFVSNVSNGTGVPSPAVIAVV
ncbi:hypothetical protein AA0111_g12665 [Alternaria arborescens]|uniref:hypothetical protein n=1 Tax=Alternaria arborescens TaxID=156630 RepID=UPI001075777A|nr:hypothetical protein AA0111_g12665 [Alternaria arborescens]RYO11962.1 hypothetical protein AA0111_g12665 [Alternaria arborescens]